MKELSVEVLKDDVVRLGAVLTRAGVLHPAGLLLHGPGEILTPAHVRILQETATRSIFLLEPGETELPAGKALAGEAREPERAEVGELLLEDAVGADGLPVLKAGSAVDAATLEAVRAARGPLTVLKPGLREARQQALAYQGRRPVPPTRPPGAGPEPAVPAKPPAVEPLLVPRAKVFVSLRDDPLRSRVAEILAREGHEVAAYSSSPEAVAALGGRPDLVVVDLADAAPLCAAVRSAPALRSAVVLAAASGARPIEYYKAMMAGANGGLPLPAERESVLETVQAALAASGRSVRVKPSVRAERRKEPRGTGGVACRLTDKFLSKPLAVSTATVLDITEGGFRIEYARPDWPDAWAHAAHSVHPKHFFYNYARANALGRELTVSLTAPGGKSLEMMATFLHIEGNGLFEVAGLQVRKSLGSVRDHMTAVRGQTAPARRP